MVREHRAGPRFSERFDDEPDEPARPGPAWGRRLGAALDAIGVPPDPRPPIGVLPPSSLATGDGTGAAEPVFAPGAITATVDGHRVRIGMRPAPDEAWERLLDAVAAEPWVASALLAGEVPDEIAGLAAGAGLEPVPRRSADLPIDCSCPDWSVPCAHARALAGAAVRAVGDDPFLLLRWRGRDRRTLLADLRSRREDRAVAAAPLESLLDRFHRAASPVPPALDPRAPAPQPGTGRTGPGRPPPPDAVLDDLPPLLLDAPDGTVDVRDVLRGLYRRLGEPPDG